MRFGFRLFCFVVTVVRHIAGPIFDEIVIGIKPDSPQATLAKKVKDLLVHNLQLLHKHEVKVAIGSDSYRQTSLPEALSLHSLKVFDNLTLLKMWCEETTATIFPNRKIGHLKEGYEASFLVLSGDPIQDFLNVKKIEMRFKQGEILSLQ